MAFSNWPQNAPPYAARTHVSDRITVLDHWSIMSGVARDIAHIQHNINTTNLFVSGWMQPAVSGWFRNINTNNLHVINLHSNNIIINDFDKEHIYNIIFGRKSSILDLTNVAISDYELPVSGKFSATDTYGRETFVLNASGFTYKGRAISGSLQNYNIVSGGPSSFKSIHIRRNLNLVNSTITVESESRIMLEGVSSVQASGTLQENRIRYHSYGGHDHSDNKIDSINLLDGTITYNDNVYLNSTRNADINLLSGQLSFRKFIHLDPYFDSDFTEVGTITSPFYTGLGFSGHINNPDLNLGCHQLASYNGYVYASSDKGLGGKGYVFKTNDFNKWTVIQLKGLSGQINGFSNFDNDLWVVASSGYTSASSDVCVKKISDAATFGNRYYWASGSIQNNTWASTGYGGQNLATSPYAYGLTAIDDCLYVYGYTGVHKTKVCVDQGLKWDGSYYELLSSTPIDSLTQAGNPVHKFLNKCRLTYYKPMLKYTRLGENYTFRDYVDGRKAIGATAGSGSFKGLFGAGLNEVTSITSSKSRYNLGKRGYFITASTVGHGHNVTNPSELIIMGPASISATHSGGNSVFAGCHPIMINAPRPTTTRASGFIHQMWYGSRSIYSNKHINHFGRDFGSNVGAEAVFAYTWPNRGLTSFWHIDANYAQPTPSEGFLLARSIEFPGFLSFPFATSGNLYYQHDNETTPTKLIFHNTTMTPISLVITKNTYRTTKDMPTYYDRPIKTSFWSTKTFDWHYKVGDAAAANPPSGFYPKTYYYHYPSKSIEFNNVIYSILKYETGFIYMSSDFPDKIDDGIMYSDIIAFEGKLYGVGRKLFYNYKTSSYDYSFHMCEFIGRKSIPITIKSTPKIMSSMVYSKFVIHKNKLYVGIGQGKFLVKRTSHKSLSQFNII